MERRKEEFCVAVDKSGKEEDKKREEERGGMLDSDGEGKKEKKWRGERSSLG